MIPPLPHIAAMSPYALADLGGPRTVSLAQNESAFAPSPAAVAAAQAAQANLALYPDPDWSDLRAAIADVHRVDPARILCGAGSMELIGCLIHAYAGPESSVLGTEFGYAFARTAAAQARAEYHAAPEAELTVSVDNILSAMRPDTRIVFLCNPGNPTGTLIPNSEILRLRNALPGTVLLVVDQAYAEFSDALEPPSEIFALAERGDTVILRTFSKAYGLAGARAGWGYFPPDVAGQVRKLLNPNNIAAASQAAAAAAMRDQDHMRGTVARTAEIRDRFAAQMRVLGLEVPAAHTNFVLLRFASAEVARRADAALRAEHLLMRGMGGYGLPDCLRATICAGQIMDRAHDVLKGVQR
ncbi:aminotransferase class I/II-fold pyridoxal phosphate-dependent enzyme [Ruegeria sediminis]|uniref:Aminotransferase class I/II-fold pyridoxal phosphate-dependent enzyme n=1 Tax=Ruegeria sediminis TaxID=2583820 RepID=A0ABY2WWP0_9RHOB|nr:histidinol-phosphate transaminase [Ruegeria sediminis]TMV06857.1 aminotransferase class I/II-fold pyridoxal phosphate-dependent enzyme [Ruegeria sediminis]